MFTIDLSRFTAAKEHLVLANDVARTLIVQLSISLLMLLSSGDSPVTAGAVFEMVTYAVVGIFAYYLVFRKLVAFR